MAAAISEGIDAYIHRNGLLALAGERTYERISGNSSMVLPTEITTHHSERTGDVQQTTTPVLHSHRHTLLIQ